jgi:hypothetical protein
MPGIGYNMSMPPQQQQVGMQGGYNQGMQGGMMNQGMGMQQVGNRHAMQGGMMAPMGMQQQQQQQMGMQGGYGGMNPMQQQAQRMKQQQAQRTAISNQRVQQTRANQFAAIEQRRIAKEQRQLQQRQQRQLNQGMGMQQQGGMMNQGTGMGGGQKCLKCEGKGGMGSFGACTMQDVHFKKPCPTCNGTGHSYLIRQCTTCQGKGGPYFDCPFSLHLYSFFFFNTEIVLRAKSSPPRPSPQAWDLLALARVTMFTTNRLAARAGGDVTFSSVNSLLLVSQIICKSDQYVLCSAFSI